MKWLLTFLFLAILTGGGISLWRKSEFKKASQEYTTLQERKLELVALEKSLKEKLEFKTKFLRNTKSDSFLDQQIKIREKEQKDVLEYISRLEKADAEMEAPLAVWREVNALSLVGRKIEKLITKRGPIIRDITFDKIENNVLYYTKEDNSVDQIELSNLGAEAMMILFNEEFIARQVTEGEEVK